VLAISADTHPVCASTSRAGEKTRMIVILDEEDYDTWLDARPTQHMESEVGPPPAAWHIRLMFGDAAN
jgi:hypothetical protein